MPTLDVATPFTVSMDPVDAEGKPRDPALPTTYVFPYPGKYDVPDDVANHWMVPPNLVDYVPPTIAEQAGVEIMVPIEEEAPPEGGGGDTMSGGLSRAREIRPGGIGTATGGAAAGRTRVGPPAGAAANAAPPAPPAAPAAPAAPPAKPAA